MGALKDGLNRLDDDLHGYDLPAGRMLRIQRARGWAVYCEYGELLLTQEGDSRDFIVNPGDRVFINSHGRVLVEAAGMGREGARLRLLRPARRELPLGPPVIRLVRPFQAQASAALNRHAERCAGLGPLNYERVFRSPRLMEKLVACAHCERDALIASYAVAVFEGGARLAAQAGRWVVAVAAALTRFVQGLRPRLPSLQETFAALMFLRSRS